MADFLHLSAMWLDFFAEEELLINLCL